jgi:putative transposase
MSNLRRYNQLGCTYFITTVTHGRQPILTKDISLFHRSTTIACDKFATELIAWAVLPDHVHFVIHSEFTDLSVFMKGFKRGYGLLFRQSNGRNYGAIWQLRFWDHIVRSQEDLNRHIDYIHINPVKHELCASPFEYEHSSFADFVAGGIYTKEWGENGALRFDGEFGE